MWFGAHPNSPKTHSFHQFHSTQFNWNLKIKIKERKLTLLQRPEEFPSCWYRIRTCSALTRIWTPRGSIGPPRRSPRSSLQRWWGSTTWDPNRFGSGRREGRRMGGWRGQRWVKGTLIWEEGEKGLLLMEEEKQHLRFASEEKILQMSAFEQKQQPLLEAATLSLSLSLSRAS